MIALPTRQIVTDSNEATRSPLVFTGVPPELLHEPYRLDVGDYALVGLELWCPIEYKSLPDLAACCAQRRQHFYDQLLKLSKWDIPHVVIGGTIEDILQGRHGSKVNPRSILGTLATYATAFPKVGFHFTSMDRTIAAAWVRELLVKGEQRFEKATTLERMVTEESEEGPEDGKEISKAPPGGTTVAEAVRGRMEDQG